MLMVISSQCQLHLERVLFVLTLLPFPDRVGPGHNRLSPYFSTSTNRFWSRHNTDSSMLHLWGISMHLGGDSNPGYQHWVTLRHCNDFGTQSHERRASQVLPCKGRVTVIAEMLCLTLLDCVEVFMIFELCIVPTGEELARMISFIWSSMISVLKFQVFASKRMLSFTLNCPYANR